MFWNEYKSKIQTVTSGNAAENINTKRILLDSSFQGVNRFFVTGFDNNTFKRKKRDTESQSRYFLPRVEIKDYNILIDGRNFYDQNISDLIARYNELIRLTTGKLKIIQQDL